MHEAGRRDQIPAPPLGQSTDMRIRRPQPISEGPSARRVTPDHQTFLYGAVLRLDDLRVLWHSGRLGPLL